MDNAVPLLLPPSDGTPTDVPPPSPGEVDIPPSEPSNVNECKPPPRSQKGKAFQPVDQSLLVS